LIRLVAATAVLSLFGLAGYAVATAPARVGDEPVGSVTVTVAGEYRGVSAAGWARKFRGRTRQLQSVRVKSRRAIRTVIHHGFGNDWLERAFLCIHSHEGSWTDSGAPFWGGLQMDSSFMSSYGSWALKAFGTADRWPVSVQLSTAIQAYKSGRGFYPWPNTARYCGLL
jgi:hypothetical protein